MSSTLLCAHIPTADSDLTVFDIRRASDPAVMTPRVVGLDQVRSLKTVLSLLYPWVLCFSVLTRGFLVGRTHPQPTNEIEADGSENALHDVRDADPKFSFGVMIIFDVVVDYKWGFMCKIG